MLRRQDSSPRYGGLSEKKTFSEHRGVEWSGSVMACPELRSAVGAVEPFRWGWGCVV